MRKILIIVLFAFASIPLYTEATNKNCGKKRPVIYAKELSDEGLKKGTLVSLGAEEGDPSQDFECQSHLEHEPTAIVNKSVNVITGTFMDSETDYLVPGAETISFQRSYVSAPTHETGPLGQGWSRNYFGFIRKYTHSSYKKPKRAFVLDSCGSVYHYGGLGGSYKLFKECYESHVTNCPNGTMGARTNILNNDVEFLKDKRGLFKKCNGEKLFLTQKLVD